MTVQEVIKLGDVIRRARLDAGLEQVELAEKIGVTRQTVGRWERGVSEPSVSQMRAMAEATEADYLYDLRTLPWRWTTAWAGRLAS